MSERHAAVTRLLLGTLAAGLGLAGATLLLVGAASSGALWRIGDTILTAWLGITG